jgi:hypothetical protein
MHQLPTRHQPDLQDHSAGPPPLTAHLNLALKAHDRPP